MQRYVLSQSSQSTQGGGMTLEEGNDISENQAFLA